jgi:hypothetical protein
LLCHGCNKKRNEKEVPDDTLTKAVTTDAVDETMQPEKDGVDKTDHIQGKNKTEADITGTQEDKKEGPDNDYKQPKKKKPRKRRGRKGKGVVDKSLLRRSPRNQKKQKSTITENDKQSAVKTLFPGDSPDNKSPTSADVTLPNPSANANKPPIESHTNAVENTDNSSALEPAATMPSSPVDENEPSQKPLIESDTTALDNIDNPEPALVPAATMPNPPTDEIDPSQNQPTKSENKYDSDDDNVKPRARNPDKLINDDNSDDEKTEGETDFLGKEGSKEKDSDEEDADDANVLETYLNSLHDSSHRRKNRGPTWYSDLREARQKMTPEEIREEKRLIKKKRTDEAEQERNRVKKIAQRNAKASADYRNGYEERQRKKRERFQHRKKD